MKKYGAILLDPPWAFRTYSKKDKLPTQFQDQHYEMLKKPELEKLPLSDLAAKDCALFLWTVDSHLDQALALLSGWGFKYKTIAFIWVKMTKDMSHPAISMGYWSRKQAEICILATRGKPRRLAKNVRQVLMEPRRQHSRKPDGFYSRIETLVEGPYLEMFARQRWPGWDAWGDETDKFSAERKFL